MAIDGIYFNDYTKTTTSAVVGKDSSDLTMNDFLNLMVAQLSNQDMLNPVSDTEFISQMAQFSSLQGIQTIQEYQLANYATSYAGKYVTIANQTDFGTIETITGYVDAVVFYDGSPKVQVNGKTYDLFRVMEVGDNPAGGSLADAASYIGKTVTVEYKDEYKDTKTRTGIVTGVTLEEGIPQIIINGETYPLSAITSVKGDDDSGSGSSGSGSSGASGASATTGASSASTTTSGDVYDQYAAMIAVTNKSGKSVRSASEIAAMMRQSYTEEEVEELIKYEKERTKT